MSDRILETKDLTKHYGGVHALKSTFVRQIPDVEQHTHRTNMSGSQRQCITIARPQLLPLN